MVLPRTRPLHTMDIVDIVGFILLFPRRKLRRALLRLQMGLRAQYQEAPETKGLGRKKRPKN